MYLVAKCPVRARESQLAVPSYQPPFWLGRTFPVAEVFPLARGQVGEVVDGLIDGREHVGLERLLGQTAGGISSRESFVRSA